MHVWLFNFPETSSTCRLRLLPETKTETFPKELRLLKRAEFVRVQKRGKKYTTRSFLILVSENKLGNITRVGIVASKKTGNSVFRNRVKRLIREAFRKSYHLFQKKFDVVIILKKMKHQLDYKMAVLELEDFARRLK